MLGRSTVSEEIEFVWKLTCTVPPNQSSWVTPLLCTPKGLLTVHPRTELLEKIKNSLVKYLGLGLLSYILVAGYGIGSRRSNCL